MKVFQAREFAVVAVLLFGLFSLAGIAQDTPNIDALKLEVQGKKPSDVRALIVHRLGPPTRDIGSGVQIEQWDIDGGVLTFHAFQGPTFEKGGVRTRLIRTNNPAALCLFGSYQMVTHPEGPHGMSYWLGDVSLAANRYTYTDSHDNLDHRKKQTNNFFILHPKGIMQVEYSPGVKPETRLEELPDGSPVATVTFISPDRRFREVYRIVTNRASMSLTLKGRGIPFQMAKGWVNYWH